MSDTSSGSVSVIAPLHNAAKYVPRLIEQLNETIGPEDRVIIVDDASRDNTLALVRRLVGEDRRYLILPEAKNIGVAAARNLAIARVETEYVWFVDHDDEWPTDALQRMRSGIADADVLFSRADYRIDPAIPGRIVDGIDAATEVSGRDALRLMLAGQVHGYLWSKLFRAEAFGEDPFPHLSSQSDFCGVVGVVARATRVRTTSDVTYHYLKRVGSITRGKSVKFENFSRATTVMIDAARSRGLDQTDPDLIARFICGFYVHALAFVPLRQGSSRGVRMQGFRLAKDALKSVDIRLLWPEYRRLYVEMQLVRLGWLPYTAITAAALTAFDAVRNVKVKLRSRRA